MTATGFPPEAGIRYNGVYAEGANTMTPSRLHAPPFALGALARTCGGPPAMSIRFSLPSAKNPIDRLSGVQNGYLAPSVPASGRAVI